VGHAVADEAGHTLGSVQRACRSAQQPLPPGRRRRAPGLRILEVFKPDVAILDIGLPGMDGYELATRIRDMPGHEQLRLLALTGYGQPEDARRTRDAGFDLHLVKPLDVQRLLQHIVAS
jgi:CheY-like chemotaxis protein